MRILLAFAFLIGFLAPAYADTITVINPDGTKTSIDIGPVPSIAPPVEPVKPPEKSAAPPRPVVANPAPAATPPKKPAVKKEAVAKKKDALVPAAKKPAEKKIPKAAAKKPPAKPAPASKQPAPTPNPIPSTLPSQQRLGPDMTPDDAIRIALDVAPPSRSVHAIPVNYKGLHAYQVIFTTEDGDASVFVDRESGRIVK